jgi:hypothetical protein
MARRRRSSLPKIAARVVPRYRKVYQAKLDRYWSAFFRRIEPELRRAIAPLAFPTKADEQAMGALVDIRLRSIGWDAEARILTSAVEPIYLDLGAEAYQAVSNDLASTVSYDLNARQLSTIRTQVARQITAVTDTSRTRIATLVTDGLEKGLSVEQIVRGVKPMTFTVRGKVPYFPGIKGLVDSWASTGTGARLGPGTGPTSSRSYLIALTETGQAFNRASINAYASSGLVDFVEVFDGAGCGWTKHDDPDLAHGSVRTLEDAASHPLAHPRCQRAFGAALAAESPSAAPGGAPKPPEPAPGPIVAPPKPKRAPRRPVEGDIDGLDPYRNPDAIAAIKEYDRALASFVRTNRGGERLSIAARARELALRESRTAALERARILTEAEARAALARLEARIAELERTVSTSTELGARSLASTRLDLLRPVTSVVRTRLPLAERLTVPRPPGRSARAREPQRLYDAFRPITEAIERELTALDLRSRWVGEVHVGRSAGAAHFGWDNAVTITPRTAAYAEKDYTKVLIHEALHGVSPMTGPSDYVGRRGWEEGVVEASSQILEARLRSRLGLPTSETGYHTYREYTLPLDEMASALGKTREDFYLDLLRSPPAERPGLVDFWMDNAITEFGIDSDRAALLQRLRVKLGRALNR